jgi:probable HAF family extracellular repeat protein
VNNLGQIVGASIVVETDAGAPTHGFLWEDGEMIDIGTLTGPDGDFSGASDINDSGQVVGQSSNQDGNYVAFVWQDGTMQELPGLSEDNYNSYAKAINNNGVAVGASSSTSNCPVDVACMHAVRWQDGQVQDLGTLGGNSSLALDVNERGDIVGYSDTAEGTIHAFLWTSGQLIDLGPEPETEYSTAEIVNNRGQILGSVGPLGEQSRPTMWYRGDSVLVEDLYPDLGQFDVNPYDVNEPGTIVGSYWPMGWPILPIHAFVSSGNAFRDISDLWGSPSTAWGVNNDGWVVGEGTVPHEVTDPEDPDTTIIDAYYLHAFLMIP